MATSVGFVNDNSLDPGRDPQGFRNVELFGRLKGERGRISIGSDIESDNASMRVNGIDGAPGAFRRADPPTRPSPRSQGRGLRAVDHATGIGSVPEPSIRCCTDEDSRPSTMCRQLSLGDAIARMKLNRPGYSRHLIEQPMLGCCSTGPLPASTIWHIASNSSRRASGTGV